MIFMIISVFCVFVLCNFKKFSSSFRAFSYVCVLVMSMVLMMILIVMFIVLDDCFLCMRLNEVVSMMLYVYVLVSVVKDFGIC